MSSCVPKSPPLTWVTFNTLSDSSWPHFLLPVCSSLAASRNSVEDAYYEDADNNYPVTRINGHPKHSCEHQLKKMNRKKN